MRRVSFSGVLAVFSAVGFLAVLASADDAKDKKGDKGEHCCHATITRVDTKKHSITVKTADKTGKQQEKTYQISKDVYLSNTDGKTQKLDDFKAGDDVVITQKDGEVTAVKESDEATITKVDPQAGTVTLKMKGQDGKDVEKVFRLEEDAEYLDSTGRVAQLDVFRSGDMVLVIESKGHIKGLKKSANKSGDSNASKTDKDKKAGDKKSGDK